MRDFVIGLGALLLGLLLYIFLYAYWWGKSDKNLEQKRAELSTLLCEHLDLSYEEAIEIVSNMNKDSVERAIKDLSKRKVQT